MCRIVSAVLLFVEFHVVLTYLHLQRDICKVGCEERTWMELYQDRVLCRPLCRAIILSDNCRLLCLVGSTQPIARTSSGIAVGSDRLQVVVSYIKVGVFIPREITDVCVRA